MNFPWWLSLSVGFLSLSQEILWVRLGAFAYGGLPHIFSFVLASYLVGIALGAHIGKWFCSKKMDLYLTGGLVLLLAGIFDLLTPWISSIVLKRPVLLPVAALAIIASAAVKSILFPIAHHLGSSRTGTKIGTSISNVYFGNIVGSTFGPLVTGFYLLDNFTTEQCIILVGIGSMLLGTLMLIQAKSWKQAITVAVVGYVLAVTTMPWQRAGVIEKLADRQNDNKPIRYLVENKHGILHTLVPASGEDIIIGGNVYDGHVGTDMSSNPNHLERAYMLAAVHPSPRRILIVGMSTGAWTLVALGFPGAEHVDVVEINPGYLNIIKRYEEVSPLIDDSRVQIHIDDARRWLKRNPTSKYDLIIQNTTFHWRSNITSLVSIEYFKELGTHLNPGGIVAVNTTGSRDILKTAQAAFPYAYKFASFVYGSFVEIKTEPAEAMRRLNDCKIGSTRAFLPQHFDEEGVAYQIAHTTLEPVETLLSVTAPVSPAIITDRNMLTEFRHGKLVAPQPLRWVYPPNPRAY